MERAPALAHRRTVLALCALGWIYPAGAASSLTIQGIALHKFEDGPLLDASYEFLPGETAYFSCRLEGFQTEQGGEDVRNAKLSWTMEERDPAGALLEPAAAGRIEASLFPQDTNWLPKFLHTFTVPPFALSGEYKITVHARDEISGDEVSGELKFRVKGRAVDPSPALAIRNFLFLTSEDDAFGMRQPLYKLGQKIWARMDVTGYKFAANNRFEIAFGMAVASPDGLQIFSQPDAGTQSGESFYPQRYAPGMLTVNLSSNSPPGTYTLIVTVEDKIGQQSVELKQPFKVE